MLSNSRISTHLTSWVAASKECTFCEYHLGLAAANCFLFHTFTPVFDFDCAEMNIRAGVRIYGYVVEEQMTTEGDSHFGNVCSYVK